MSVRAWAVCYLDGPEDTRLGYFLHFDTTEAEERAKALRLQNFYDVKIVELCPVEERDEARALARRYLSDLRPFGCWDDERLPWEKFPPCDPQVAGREEAAQAKVVNEPMSEPLVKVGAGAIPGKGDV